ncbi:MAG: DsbA family protein [Alphaproteobacteria bacterium]|nr:DsbA family protein [Alphaproteobacteria bacterium]
MRGWLVGLMMLLGATALAQDRPAFTPEQEKAIREILRDTLIKNPDILVEAMRALEARQKEQQEEDNQKALKTSRNELYDDPDSVVGGNPKGDITLVEFFDYRCGYCKRAHVTVEELKKSDGKLRVIYKEYPILGPDSVIASRAAIAVRKSPKYLAFHDALMRAKGQLDEASVLQIAAEVGLDAKQIKADMNKAEVTAVIRRNHALAEKLGISGTPAFVVGDSIVPGAISLADMKALVKEARTGCRAC